MSAMKKITVSVISSLYLLLGFVEVTAAQTDGLESTTSKLLSYQDRITVDFLNTHLSVLAADSMEGRDTGMPGQKKAADYLSQQYKKMGLKPAGDEQSYFQNFDLDATRRDSTVFELFKLNGGKKKLTSRSVESRKSAAHFIRAFGGSDTLSGAIVFAGFGVNDPARGVHHLESRNLKGKWVMVFQEIPAIVDGDTLLDPNINNADRFRSIIGEKQAAGVLLIPSMTEHEFIASSGAISEAYSEPVNMRLKYLENSNGGGFPKGYNLVKPSTAAQILGLEKNAGELRKLKRSIIKNITGFKPRPTGYALTHTPYTSQVTVETENVAALIEGVDPGLKDEVVVLTSHYDHVGIGRPDSTGDAIYNGADDDGSGTVALMNIARVLTEARANGYGTRRSILILHVTGEEIGLFGSRYYSDHPVFPIEKTVANINIDMIGRIDPAHEKKGITDYAYIIGSEIISSELDSLLKVANSKSGNIRLDKKYNDLDDPNQFYRRSDHWNFGRLGVPFVFFFTGVHEDYHRPSDEIHKIRFEKMAKIIKTIYATAVVVANEEHAPTVDNQEFIEKTKVQPR